MASTVVPSSPRAEGSPWGAATFRWVMGLVCAGLGALILVAPHRFAAPLFDTAPVLRDAYGVASLAAGVSLLGVAVLRPGPAVLRAVHLLAAGTLLALAAGFAAGSIWVAGLANVVLAAAAAAGGWIPASGRATRDVYAFAMGLVGALNGAALIALPAASRAPYFGPARAWVPLLGGALLGGGLLLAAAHAAKAVPPRLRVLAHLAGGLAFLSFGLVVSARQEAWTALAVNAFYGLTLMAGPWLAPRLEGLDTSALRVRLAFALAASMSLAIVATAAVVSHHGGGATARGRDLMLAFLLLVLPLAVSAGAVLARRIVRPLDELTRAVAAMPSPGSGPVLSSGAVTEVARLGAAFEDLQRRLAERTAQAERLATELQERADALAEADRRKNEFLAILGHELRNPVGAIANAAHLLKSAPLGNERAERAVAVVQRQVVNVIRLLDDLLDIARVTTGRVLLRPERLDLRDVVRATAEAVRPLLESNGQVLALRLPAEPLPVHADAARIEQVLGNLLRNAAQYSPAGARVEMTAEADRDDAVVRVRDEGAGIAPDLLPHLFEPFRRGAHTGTAAHSGLGIGLALARTLATLHGGSLTGASGGPGQGSEFTVRLPRARGGEVPVDTPASPPAGVSALRILVVDDNADAAASLAELLATRGHVVDVAADGPAALDRARRQPPDIALLDLGMPGMDGYELARLMRSEARLSTVRLVALTGFGQEPWRRRAGEVGFDDYLVKPLDLPALERLLARRP